MSYPHCQPENLPSTFSRISQGIFSSAPRPTSRHAIPLSFGWLPKTLSTTSLLIQMGGKACRNRYTDGRLNVLALSPVRPRDDLVFTCYRRVKQNFTFGWQAFPRRRQLVRLVLKESSSLTLAVRPSNSTCFRRRATQFPVRKLLQLSVCSYC